MCSLQGSRGWLPGGRFSLRTLTSLGMWQPGGRPELAEAPPQELPRLGAGQGSYHSRAYSWVLFLPEMRKQSCDTTGYKTHPKREVHPHS